MISYKHEPFVDFTNEENKKAYQEALQTVEGYLGQDYPLYIGAEKVTTDEKIVSYNPADKARGHRPSIESEQGSC